MEKRDNENKAFNPYKSIALLFAGLTHEKRPNSFENGRNLQCLNSYFFSFGVSFLPGFAGVAGVTVVPESVAVGAPSGVSS